MATIPYSNQAALTAKTIQADNKLRQERIKLQQRNEEAQRGYELDRMKIAAQAADEDRKAREAEAKEQQAVADKRAQAGKSESSTPISDTLSMNQLNPQAPSKSLATAPVEMPQVGGGMSGYATGPNVAGSGEGVAPFLTETQRISEVGPEKRGPIYMPVRRSRTTQTVKPNVMTAAQHESAQMERYRTAVREQQWEAEQSQRDRAYRTNTYMEFAKEGITENTGAVVGALERGDMDAADALLKGDKLLSVRLREAQLRAAGVSVRADLARIAKLELETDVARADFLRTEQQRSLLDIAGIPDSGMSSVGGTELSGMKTGEVVRALDNNVLDDDGKVLTGREASAQAIQREMFKRGVVVGFEATGKGIWGTSIMPGARTSSASLSKALQDIEAYAQGDTAAKQRLLDSGLFEMSGDTMVPIAETKPNHVNAEISGAVSAVHLWRMGVKDRSGQAPTVPEPVVEVSEETTSPKSETPRERARADVLKELNVLRRHLSTAPSGEKVKVARKIKELEKERRNLELDTYKGWAQGAINTVLEGAERQHEDVRNRAQEILTR